MLETYKELAKLYDTLDRRGIEDDQELESISENLADIWWNLSKEERVEAKAHDLELKSRWTNEEKLKEANNVLEWYDKNPDSKIRNKVSFDYWLSVKFECEKHAPVA